MFINSLSSEFNDRVGLSLNYSYHNALKLNKPIVSACDKKILRELAERVSELAHNPLEEDKKELWYKHNNLIKVRPLVFCDPENGWYEIIRPEDLSCEGGLSRVIEYRLKKEIFWAYKMKDDRVIEPVFPVPYIYDEIDRGLHEQFVGKEEAGDAYTWVPPLKDYSQMSTMRYKSFKLDKKKTAENVSVIGEIFSDVLPLRYLGAWWWSLCPTHDVINLRGLEQMMLDMYDEPDNLHKLMAFLRDEALVYIDKLESENLLTLNNDGTYVASGGFGWTNELPVAGFDKNHIRTRDLWGFAESQETSCVSPQMFNEFVLHYQLPVLECFGLNCYGCCEPLDTRWQYVKKIPRLRRVSVSHWADFERMAEILGENYVLSWKPTPSDLAVPQIDQEYLRQKIRKAISVSEKYGCHLEIIMKDCHTLSGNPQNIISFARIAREEAGGETYDE